MRILMLAAIAALSLGTAGMAQPITTEELKALDTDGDGKVSQPEFDVFLNEAFVKLDANGDKVVTVHEAVVVMTPEQFAAADTDGDGRLTLQEFKTAAQKDFVAADSNRDGSLN